MKYIALVGACPTEAKKKLTSLPMIEEVITLPPDTLVDSPISSHPDTVLCIFDNKLYCHDEYAKQNSELLDHICKQSGLSLCSQSGERSGKYPYDTAFNALPLHGMQKVVGRKCSLCAPLANACINVNQGYAACAALALLDGSVITADNSIKKALSREGIPVHTVSGKDILLHGYDKGFIGGCGGVFENTLCIFGDCSSATGQELQKICSSTSLSLISLCSGPLTDYGGVKFVKLPQ